MIDIHTVGAGGGSIGWIDAGGALRVGPHSAGANPGPACYGKGGEHPTVTAANLVLERIAERSSLGGGMTLDRGGWREEATPVEPTASSPPPMGRPVSCQPKRSPPSGEAIASE